MKKAMEVASYVMLGLVIVAVIIFLSPWIPVNGGLWSPLDVVKDKLDDFYVGSVEGPAWEPVGEPVEESVQEPMEEQYGPAVISDTEWGKPGSALRNLHHGAGKGIF